eukprot:gene10464-biopygen7630
MARRYEENEATPAVQENIRENARPQRTIVDIQTFSGKDEEDIAEWLIRWEVAANANNWTPQQQLTMMPVYLTGRAGRLFWRFPENVRNSLEELKDSLDETFNTEEKRYLARQKLHEIKQGSKESVIEFSERVDKLVMKGHDGLDSAAQKDRIASECFIKGLRQEIKETVWEKCPNSFQEAVQSAERREVFLNSVGKRSAGVNEVSEDLIGLIQKFNSDRERSNQEIWKAIQSLTTAVQELATARRNDNTWNHPPGAERRTPIVCYGCNQTGHIRRNCPLAQYRQPMHVNPALARRCPAAEEPISEQTTPRS